MGPTSALALYAVIWFMVLFITLPIGLRTQGDEGEIVPGTMASSPSQLNLKRKLWLVTGIATLVWAVTAGIIVSGWVTVDDWDLFRRFGPGDGPLFPTDGETNG